MYLRCYNWGMDEMETTELDKCIALYIETKTPREIAERAGVTPERVIARAEEMKDEADALSIEASIHFLMRRLNAIAANAQKAADDAPSAKDAAGLYSASVSAITQSLKQLNLFKKENDGAVAELNNKRIQFLLRMFDSVVEKGVSDIALEHGLDKGELLTSFQKRIMDAARELDS